MESVWRNCNLDFNMKRFVWFNRCCMHHDQCYDQNGCSLIHVNDYSYEWSTLSIQCTGWSFLFLFRRLRFCGLGRFNTGIYRLLSRDYRIMVSICHILLPVKYPDKVQVLYQNAWKWGFLQLGFVFSPLTKQLGSI